MALKSSSQISTDLATWITTELQAKIDNTAPIIYPDTHQAVLQALELIIKDITDSHYNKVDGVVISNVTGLTSALAAKETADATILKQANVVDNLVSTSSIFPLSAAQGKTLKDSIDALPSANADTALDFGNANQVTASELRSHLDDSGIHFLQSAINHDVILNRGTNTHAQIDSHIADATTHFTQAAIDHTSILNIGSNTHAQIDSHIAATNNPHTVTLVQAVNAQALALTKGGLYVANGSSIVAVGVGTNGQVLSANSLEASGVEWVDNLGEVNTISSVGSGTTLVNGKTGVDLRVKSLGSLTSALTVATTSTDVSLNLIPGNISHTDLADKGTNTHSQIDAHIASTANPHSVDINDVTPTTTKGDIIVDSGGTATRLAVGSNGQVLVADSVAAEGVSWSSDLATATAHVGSISNPHSVTLTQASNASGLFLTKGNLYPANGSSVVSLGVGSDGQVLTADSGAASGLAWASVAGEVNTGANIAGTGVGVFDNKTSSELRFRRIVAADSTINVILSGSGIEVGVDPSAISHTALTDIGSFTHAQIDTHINSVANPHSVTKAQVGLSEVQNIKVNLGVSIPPTATDDISASYTVGSIWIDTTANKSYVCVDHTTSAAIWKEFSWTQQTALTSTLTGLTQAGAFTPDYAVQALTNTSPWGFASQDEAETVLSVVLNLQTRINELETKLQTVGILA